MFEQQLKNFFQEVGAVHATNVLRDLPGVIPLMKRYPEVTASEVRRFRSYLVGGPTHNVPAALGAIYLIAREVPGVRDQIIKDLGDALYQYKELMPDHPNTQVIEDLLLTLELPVSEHDAQLRGLARSLMSLRQPIILVIGAGFSYDTMPITNELHSLLIPLLKDEGIDDPVQLVANNDREVWQIVKRIESRFKERFAGRCSASVPTFQHELATQMLHDGQITHLVSFNWDDLCERAYFARYGTPIPKVITDSTPPATQSLWKLHGDVERMNEPWVFPYENGRVFDSLIESLDQNLTARAPAIAVIVGYSETETAVRERFITWLERHVPSVLRVRPTWPETDNRGIRDTARRFFQRLNIYMDLEKR